MSLNYTVLATGALGLTVALAWNTAANKVITGLFPHDGSTKASVAYAVAVTFFVIALVAAINHVGEIVGTPELPEQDAAREPMSSNIVDIRWPVQGRIAQWFDAPPR